jgi:hypothetical protein
LWNEKKLGFTFVSECKCGAQEVKRETAKWREGNIVERKKTREKRRKEW